MLNELQEAYLIKFLVGEMAFNQRLKMYQQIQKYRGFFAKNSANTDFPGIGAMDALTTIYSAEKELDYKPCQLAGKCSNGAERDHGLVVHAVNFLGALCEAKPGRLSVGWVEPWNDAPVNCPKCLERIRNLTSVCTATAQASLLTK